MPRLVFYEERDGEAPVEDWLRRLKTKDAKAYAKCAAKLRRLAECGHELRRPTADYLRDGIYELRIRHGRVNYRLLYFFFGQQVAVVTHALTKEDVVPVADIERALARKAAFEENPSEHGGET